MQMGVSYKVVYPEKFLKAQARREKEIVGKMDEVLPLLVREEPALFLRLLPEGQKGGRLRTSFFLSFLRVTADCAWVRSNRRRRRKTGERLNDKCM